MIPVIVWGPGHPGVPGKGTEGWPSGDGGHARESPEGGVSCHDHRQGAKRGRRQCGRQEGSGER